MRSQLIPPGRAAKVLGALFLTFWLWPVFLQRTRSILRHITHVPETPANGQRLSLAALCVFAPIVLAWRQGWKLGTATEMKLLLLVAWTLGFDRSVLVGWSGYARLLF